MKINEIITLLEDKKKISKDIYMNYDEYKKNIHNLPYLESRDYYFGKHDALLKVITLLEGLKYELDTPN